MTFVDMNVAKSRFRSMWFAHPLIGDPSFDTFERFAGNPVHEGIGVWDWPVNGFLFVDPVSANWYVYVSLYAKGYRHCGTITLIRSTDKGKSWRNLGPVFDGRGLAERYTPEDAALATLDASVVYENGIYHMVYGWGSLKESQGGIAYAYSNHPEGPFLKHPHPIKNETDTEPILGMYKRTYASTLIRRRDDWLILAMMSMPRNTGGSWSLVALTSEQPDGPYGNPAFLLYPQSPFYLPAPIEFYPAYVHDGYVYAPSTSVGRNRTYQAVFRAELESAHSAEAWQLDQEGSCWHSEARQSERYGIWGQTYSGQVMEDGMLHAMYPALNERGEGTINLASRPWSEPYDDNFVLSGNNAAAVSFVRQGYEMFRLTAELTSTKAFSVVWGWNGPVGSTVMPRWADGMPHANMFTDGLGLSVIGDEFALIAVTAQGSVEVLEHTEKYDERDACWGSTVSGAGTEPGADDSFGRPPFREPQSYRIVIRQEASSCQLDINGKMLTVMQGAAAGRIGLIAGNGALVRCTRFEIEGESREHWVELLPGEGLAGAAQCPDKWDFEMDSSYSKGFGYRSTERTGFAEETVSMLKWNFRGDAFRVKMPVKGYGKISVLLDGQWLEDIVLLPDGGIPGSRVVIGRDGLADGNHAVTMTLLEGEMSCDVFSYRVHR
ncbi:hypothetical protein [Paenibacillus contaminans]|uniref:Uncharacterized protein n=1 Tax=Paenibacillus contaminans TaxID=450362 RepID=A0A329N1E5_9BACL|nr:hypothetical protein [Paenibacillus contaminans]RAV23307.1 hypothetical protein DQG23_03700 [Paenibacillus contaminans]